MQPAVAVGIGLAVLVTAAVAIHASSGPATVAFPSSKQGAIRAQLRPAFHQQLPRSRTIQVGPSVVRAWINPLPRHDTQQITNEDSDAPASRSSFASGLAMHNGLVSIIGYDAWVKFSSAAIEEALVDGAGGAAGVLTYVMRRAIPTQRWPPEEGTLLHAQWMQMVRVVAEKLRLEPEPEPQRTPRRLTLV